MPPYGQDDDETPFAPRDQGPGAMPFGSEAYGDDAYGGPADRPADRTAAWGDEPVAGHAHGSFPPGPPGDDRFDGRFDDPHRHPGGMPPMPSDAPGRQGRRRSTPLIIGAALVAGLVLIGGGIGLSSLLKDDSEDAAAPAQAASTPTPTPSPTKPVLAPVKLKSRSTDPKPLTLKEVFGNGKFKAHGHKYVRTAVNHKRSCTAVVGGKTLEATLKKGGCTQALRATYALTGGQLVGTVGVFNLQTEAAAEKAVKAAADKDAFLQALPGKGVSKTNGRGEALGTSQARGHYLLMTWVQRPDGKKIAKKHHTAVRVFGAEMVKGSNLAMALHYRETEGKPLQK